MKGRLNVFQASMLRWREMYPYNAVHAIRIARPLEATRLAATIEAYLSAHGLTGLVLDPARGRYEYTGGDSSAVGVRIVPATNDALPVLSDEIERELNAAFARSGRIDPFRFFAIDSKDAFHLGVAYDHFVAGGDSIVILLKDLWERYCDAAPDRRPRSLELYPRRFRGLILRHPLRVIGGTRRLWELPASCRRAFRPRYPRAPDLRNGFACLRLGPPEVERFAAAAKAWGVTRNDLLIALVMQALSPFTEERLSASRRNEVAIASIINLRREFGYAASAAFGQFLSSFRVSHKVPQGIGLRQLAQDVRVNTAHIRNTRRYYQTLLAMQMSGAFWRFLSPERRANFHCKNYPVWAGTTPLDVNAIWKEAGGAAPVPEYVRGVSTGPLAPLVVAATSAGDLLHIGASYRLAAFERENIDRILGQIKQAIGNLPS